MKTLKFCLLLAFLTSPIFIFSNFRPKKEQPVQTTVQADAALNRLRVVVNKPETATLMLRVLDENDGWPLHEQLIPAGPSTVQTHLNLRALPDGRYRVEVGDQQRVQTSLFHLTSSAHPTLKRQIDIQPLY